MRYLEIQNIMGQPYCLVIQTKNEGLRTKVLTQDGQTRANIFEIVAKLDSQGLTLNDSPYGYISNVGLDHPLALEAIKQNVDMRLNYPPLLIGSIRCGALPD